jgi:hypothetical protein
MTSENKWLQVELLDIFAAEPYFDDADGEAWVYAKVIDQLDVKVRLFPELKVLAVSLGKPGKINPYFEDFYLVNGEVEYQAESAKLILHHCWLLASDTDVTSSFKAANLDMDNHFRVELTLGESFRRDLFFGG